MFVFISGKILNFCSNRCEKNLHKLKRKPLTVKWTEAYRKANQSQIRAEKIEQRKAKKLGTPTAAEEAQ